MKQTHALEANGLTKRFRAQTALAGFDLSLPSGSLCALLGPNGSGKTTALRIILGLLRPNGGESRVLGQSSNAFRSDAFQRIGYVAEGSEYPGWMTGAELFAWCRDVYETWDGTRFYLSNITPKDESAAKTVQITVNRDPAKYFLTYPGGCVLALGIVLLFTRRKQK